MYQIHTEGIHAEPPEPVQPPRPLISEMKSNLKHDQCGCQRMHIPEGIVEQRMIFRPQQPLIVSKADMRQRGAQPYCPKGDPAQLAQLPVLRDAALKLANP